MRRNLRYLMRFSILVAVAVVTGPMQLRAQSAAEYTLGTSKAATGAAGFGKVMNRSVTKAANKISENLKTSTHENPARVMQKNRTAIEKLAGEDGGTLNIKSDPDDAAVFIDGQLVARTPVEIKVSAGDHKIMVTRPDRDQWSKEVKIAKGKTLEISAHLINTNPSVISLDFPDVKKN